MSKLIDITGQKFGKLTVIERTENSSKGGARWICKCECGNSHIAVGTNLRNGTTTRCKQCAIKERTEKLKQKKDISGNRYGKMLVLKRLDETDKWNSTIYLCKCDCGKIFKASRGNIVQGNHKSCGKCNNRSNGELKIEEILKKNNISYIKEKTFEDLILPSRQKTRFDFYINNKYLIEFDGKQHFESTGGTWFTPEYTKQIQLYDQIKNNYCKENNIPLIRIPYTHLNNMVLEDLLLDSSDFII